MIVMMLAALVAHANARSEATLSLIDFIGQYHGVVRPQSTTNKEHGDVFSLTLDQSGITIPVEMKPHGSNEVARTWLVHHGLDRLVYQADSEEIRAFAAPNRICVGLRTTMWTDVTDVVCFQKNAGDRDTVFFVPIKNSIHAGRAELMRDRKPNARDPDTTADGIRKALIDNGIYVDARPPRAGAERALEILRIKFAELDSRAKIDTLETIGKGFELASAAEKLVIMPIVQKALVDDQDSVRWKGLQQIALYVRTGSFVRPVLDALANPNDNPLVLQMAIDAADSLLESMTPQLDAQAHLIRFHWTNNPSKLFRQTNGMVDVADVSALRALESPRPFAATYDRDHRPLLIHALIALGEDERQPVEVRRGAVTVALEHLPKNREIQDYLRIKANFSISTPQIKTIAAELMRMFDANPEVFDQTVEATIRDPRYERYFREKLSKLQEQRLTNPKTLKQTHCEWMLEHIPEAN